MRRAGFCPTTAHEDWAVPQVCQAERKNNKESRLKTGRRKKKRKERNVTKQSTQRIMKGINNMT